LNGNGKGAAPFSCTHTTRTRPSLERSQWHFRIDKLTTQAQETRGEAQAQAAAAGQLGNQAAATCSPPALTQSGGITKTDARQLKSTPGVLQSLNRQPNSKKLAARSKAAVAPARQARQFRQVFPASDEGQVAQG